MQSLPHFQSGLAVLINKNLHTRTYYLGFLVESPRNQSSEKNCEWNCLMFSR